MNKGLLTLNIFLVIGVAVLFYLFFSNKEKKGATGQNKKTSDPTSSTVFKIAYFDMDSIEANFSLFKDMQKEVSKKEDSMQTVLNSARMALQNKYKKYQEQGTTMTEEQVKVASEELRQMDMGIKNSEMTLNQSFQNFYMNKQQEVISQIKKYCLEFNKDGKYSFIISNEPGLVYYKDTTYNITSELLKGLNALYDNQKKN
jgi:outer membrane protein